MNGSGECIKACTETRNDFVDEGTIRGERSMRRKKMACVILDATLMHTASGSNEVRRGHTIWIDPSLFFGREAQR